MTEKAQSGVEKYIIPENQIDYYYEVKKFTQDPEAYAKHLKSLCDQLPDVKMGLDRFLDMIFHLLTEYDDAPANDRKVFLEISKTKLSDGVFTVRILFELAKVAGYTWEEVFALLSDRPNDSDPNVVFKYVTEVKPIMEIAREVYGQSS